jgi:hypothetical protein
MLKFGETSIKLNRCNNYDNEEDDVEDVHIVHADDTDLLPVNFEIFSNTSDSIVAETELTTDQQLIFQKLIQFIETSNVFAYDYGDIEGCNL